MALTLLMWKAGLRVSEIVALDVSDVKIQSSQRGVVQVRLGKGRKSRIGAVECGGDYGVESVAETATSRRHCAYFSAARISA